MGMRLLDVHPRIKKSGQFRGDDLILNPKIEQNWRFADGHHLVKYI